MCDLFRLVSFHIKEKCVRKCQESRIDLVTNFENDLTSKFLLYSFNQPLSQVPQDLLPLLQLRKDKLHLSQVFRLGAPTLHRAEDEQCAEEECRDEVCKDDDI